MLKPEPPGNVTRTMRSRYERIIEILRIVAETDEVEKNPDLPLYHLHVLDSMKTVRLIVEFSQEFGIEISPAEFERERWETPRKIVQDIESRV
jgi:D-alanine--poly(phosphoribitol) ligase subunit 2